MITSFFLRVLNKDVMFLTSSATCFVWPRDFGSFELQLIFMILGAQYQYIVGDWLIIMSIFGNCFVGMNVFGKAYDNHGTL